MRILGWLFNRFCTLLLWPALHAERRAPSVPRVKRK